MAVGSTIYVTRRTGNVDVKDENRSPEQLAESKKEI